MQRYLHFALAVFNQRPNNGRGPWLSLCECGRRRQDAGSAHRKGGGDRKAGKRFEGEEKEGQNLSCQGRSGRGLDEEGGPGRRQLVKEERERGQRRCGWMEIRLCLSMKVESKPNRNRCKEPKNTQPPVRHPGRTALCDWCTCLCSMHCVAAAKSCAPTSVHPSYQRSMQLKLHWKSNALPLTTTSCFEWFQLSNLQSSSVPTLLQFFLSWHALAHCRLQHLSSSMISRRSDFPG